jgi:hypothetical protein
VNKISQTSPDKIRGKLVKYKLGDCLVFKTSNGDFIAAIITGKFNAYYNLTFIEWQKNTKPTWENFKKGRFFGTRFGSIEDITYAVEQRMIKCKYIDDNADIESIGTLNLITNFSSAGYAYLNDIEGMYKYYLNELPIRIEKTSNGEKFPELGFVSRHLIYTKNIIN